MRVLYARCLAVFSISCHGVVQVTPSVTDVTLPLTPEGPFVMSSADLKRPASTPSTNPIPTKKMHLEVQDIFGGDEGKNNAADEVLRQSYLRLFDLLATNCRTLSKLELVESGIKLVILKAPPTIRWPGDDVILHELDNTAGFHDSIVECFEMRNHRGIRNLVGLWFPCGVDSCAHA